jgi:hypothetical protein
VSRRGEWSAFDLPGVEAAENDGTADPLLGQILGARCRVIESLPHPDRC